MRHPRTSIYFLNIVGLLAFAVTVAIISPPRTDEAVGYGVIFLMLLLVVYTLNFILRRRWGGFLTFMACAVTFGCLTGAADHVAVGLAAAFQMLVCIRAVPEHVATTVTRATRQARADYEAAETERLEQLVAEGEAAAAYLRGARSIH